MGLQYDPYLPRLDSAYVHTTLRKDIQNCFGKMAHPCRLLGRFVKISRIDLSPTRVPLPVFVMLSKQRPQVR